MNRNRHDSKNSANEFKADHMFDAADSLDASNGYGAPPLETGSGSEFHPPSPPSETGSSDVDDQRTIDQRIRINELRELAREAGGGEMVEWTADDCPLDLQEAFWESVLAWETAPDSSFREMLVDSGVSLPEPTHVDDDKLPGVLETVIRGLAELHIYLSHTDHLSDRQLYEKLSGELLDQPTKRAPVSEAWHCELDLLGGCSKEDLLLLQTYYPDDWCYGPWDESRLGPQPSSKLPPFDRDHWLPKNPNADDA